MFKRASSLDIVYILGRGPMHLRKISKLLKLQPSTVSKCLEELETNSVVDFSMDKNRKQFFLRKTQKSYLARITAEHSRVAKAIENPKIKYIMEQVKSLSKTELIILFGSYAKKFNAKAKTITLFIDTRNQTIKKELEENIDNIVIMTGMVDFTSEVGKSILQDHLILQNVEKYYRRLKKFQEKNKNLGIDDGLNF